MRSIFTISFTVITAFLVLSFAYFDDPKNSFQLSSSEIMITSQKQMDGNNIRTWYRNNGSFNRDPVTGNAGFEWPKGAGPWFTVRYASGIWIGAKVNDSLRIAVAEYDYEYLSGYIDDNGNPQGRHDPDYRVYVINKGDTISDDYHNWPINQGAYVDQNGKPVLIGEQSMWMVFTDGYPEAHSNNAGSTRPLKAQILCYNWCFNFGYSSLNNVVFSEYRIINRSSSTWDSTFIALWTDDDIGSNASNDASGSDSTINLGYTYNFGQTSPPYGALPPAVGFVILDGPLKYTGIHSDVHSYYSPPGSQNKIQKTGYQAMDVYAFNIYYGGDPNFGDPRNSNESWNALRGLITQSGGPHINPITGKVTKFPFSGDPESQTGWRQTEGRDTRFLLSSGPVLVAPGDTQRVVYAQLVAQGSNNLNSVTKLKQLARTTKRAYDVNFNFDINIPSPQTSAYAPGDGKIYLNWDDSSEVRSFENVLSGGMYKFQGYNIYQIKNFSYNPSKEDTVLIKTYDIKDGVTNIYDSVYLNEWQGVVYGIVQRGSDNGISKYHVTEKDTFTISPFINGSQYKFALTAYYYDPLGGLQTLPKVIESPKNILKVIPQSLTPGTHVSYNFGDTLITDQKDLAVMPIIFKPFELRSARYSMMFSGVENDLNWTLIREQNGVTTTLLENEKNFAGTQDTAKVADGMLMVAQTITDSGIVRDVNDPVNSVRRTTLTGAWEWEGAGDIWFTGPDTTAIKGIPNNALFRGRQFQSRSIGMSFPTANSFRGSITRVKANGTQLISGTGTNTLPTGGPLRKIQIVFGQSHSSMAYRYVPTSGNALATDSSLLNTPYADMVSVPFSVFAVDDLDSSNGAPRRLNLAFVDADNNGLWDPDDTPLGKFQITYIFTTDYNETPNSEYTSRNIGFPSPVLGFGSFDIMYAWVPRVKVESGVPMTYTSGDKLTVSPYRPTRGDFVPGYPVKYSWETQGTQTGNINLAATQIDRIKVFPNPYYGFSELEFTDNPEKMVYFSHLPQRATIYIYTLDGVLVRKIERNESSPEVSLEKWDLKNDEGSEVASGMYLAFVDAKEVGKKVFKLAVFTRTN
jgi:hypothetical protein